MCWLFLILVVCVFVVVSAFCFLDGKMVNYGDDCSTVFASYAPGNDVDEALSSWKMDVQPWIEKEESSLFVIFGTSMMILHSTTLHTKTISKAEKV
jgi:hypothetical protein